MSQATAVVRAIEPVPDPPEPDPERTAEEVLEEKANNEAWRLAKAAARERLELATVRFGSSECCWVRPMLELRRRANR